MKKVIFVVEDDRSLQKAWQNWWAAFDYNIEVVSAYTLEEAESLWREGGKKDIVIMDGCLDGNNYNTSYLIREIRQTFTGPMIAASASPELRKLMMQAG